MNDVVARVVYEVSFKHTFNNNIFQILYVLQHENIHGAKNEKKVAVPILLPPSGI